VSPAGLARPVCEGCPLGGATCPFYRLWGRRGACITAARRRLALLGVVRVLPGISPSGAYDVLGWWPRWTANWRSARGSAHAVYRLRDAGLLRAERSGRSSRLYLTPRGERLLERSTRRLGRLAGPNARRVR